jgi:hypothetical protein
MAVDYHPARDEHLEPIAVAGHRTVAHWQAPSRLASVGVGSVNPDPRRSSMSVLIRFTPAGLTAAQYDESVRRLEDAGAFPPDGLDYHVCFGTEGSLRVSEIWDTSEQLEAFGERLMPILSEIGIDAGEPEVLEIHNIVKR